MELTDVYSDKIIEIAGNLPDLPRIPDADASAKKVSRICGSVIEVDLNLDNGVVSAYGHTVSACALGQTSASIVANNIVGSTPAELRQLQADMRAMLKEGGPPPKGKWSDLRYLAPLKDYPARHQSTLLVFDAVVACLDCLETPGAAA